MNENPMKYNDIICGAVKNCTKEIMDLMKQRGLKLILFAEHNADMPGTVLENSETGKYVFDTLESIKLVKVEKTEYLEVRGSESGLTGYLDDMYGDFFNVADTIGNIYQSVIDSFNNVDNGFSYFNERECEEKYSQGVTKDMWNTIIKMLELTDSEISRIKSMKITESNDKFDYIYVDFNDKFTLNSANYCAIRNKENNEIYIPISSNGAYPATLKDIALYSWTDNNHEKIMFNNNNEMETYDTITIKRLEYLNGEGNEKVGNIFDGIKFVWHRRHTMCVQSQIDINNNKNDLYYIAVYKHRNDIVPIKFYREELITKF